MEKGAKGLRIGIPKEYFAEGMDADVEKNIKDAIKKISDELELKIKQIGINSKFFIIEREQILFYLSKETDEEPS